MIDKLISQLDIRLIRQINWEEVFLFWFQCEGNNENWINLARQRGYSSWAEWRLESYANPFECQKADWGLYEVTDPARVVSFFYGGPFRTWIERYYNNNKEKPFFELAKRKDIVENTAIQSMINNFPTDKMITCLEVKDKIYTIEGMHRCCALAIMNEQTIRSLNKLHIIIGKSPLASLPVVGQNIKIS